MRWSVSVIFCALVGFSVCCKVQIQPAIAYYYADGEIRCMYKAVNKNKAVHRYIESLAIHTGSPTVNWEENTSYISVVEDKIVTPRVKHLDIHIYFYKKNLTNVIFVPKYEKSGLMLSNVCTKPFPGPIISRFTKCITGFRLYPTSDTEHYQLMRLHEFVVK